MARFSIANREIVLARDLSDIDRFVVKAARILERFTEYAIVSGYVAILFGRARASEDVDAFLQNMPKEQFFKLHEAFLADGFEWTIDDPGALYSDYLLKGLPVSVWEKDFPLLRLDLKFPKFPSQQCLFSRRIRVMMGNAVLWIADIESTIAYKEEIACSDKDLLDARHLRLVFDRLDEALIENYKCLFRQEFRK